MIHLISENGKNFSLPIKKSGLKTGIIRQKIMIENATPNEVYEALLSSKKHSDFTGSPAKVSARVGAKFTAWNEYIIGKNLDLQSGKSIVQEWRTTEFPPGYGPSLLKFSLKKVGTGTEITMVQSKVPASQVEKYDEGWQASYWEPMKEYFRVKMKYTK
jgi:activator of HSP90 ATPase